MELRDAVCEALREGGPDLLRNHQRFLAFVMDYADSDDSLTIVLESNCDAEFMSFFSDLAQDPSPERVLTATDHATTLLAVVRQINPSAASRVVCELVLGICAYANVRPPDEVMARAWVDAGPTGPAWQAAGDVGSRFAGGSVVDGRGPLPDAHAGVPADPRWAGPASVIPAGMQQPNPSGGPAQGPAPAPMPSSQKSRGRAVLVVALVACAALVGIIAFLLMPRGQQEGSGVVASVQGAAELAGTWSPVSVSMDGEDAQDYDARFRVAQEGDLNLRDDGTFTRSVFPDLLEGTWEQTGDATVELMAKDKDGLLYAWDEDDLRRPIAVAVGDDQLSLTYGDGVEVTYGRGTKKRAMDSFLGLWQVVELAQDDVVQYGRDVFEADRAAGWYTEYLDVLGNGTLVWDRQGDRSQGSWRMSDDDTAVFYVRDTREQGAYWRGIMELDGECVVFRFGDGDWETFERMEADNRSDLRMPDRTSG